MKNRQEPVWDQNKLHSIYLTYFKKVPISKKKVVLWAPLENWKVRIPFFWKSTFNFERKPKFYPTIHSYMIQLYTLYIKTLLLFYLRNKIFKKRNVGLLWDRQFMGFISPLTWESVVVRRAKINVISLLLGFSQVVKYN